MAVVAYLRVSTKGQSVGRQDYLLDKAGVVFKTSYVDKVSGKTKDRPELTKLLLEVRAGDTVYCESISRLGRSLKDLIEIVESLRERGVRVVILKEGIDTDSSTYKLLLGIFGAIAEMERETISERVMQGVERCKATGQTATGRWFGRRKMTASDLPRGFIRYHRQLVAGEISKSEMARLIGVGRATLYRWLAVYGSSAQ